VQQPLLRNASFNVWSQHCCPHGVHTILAILTITSKWISLRVSICDGDVSCFLGERNWIFKQYLFEILVAKCLCKVRLHFVLCALVSTSEKSVIQCALLYVIMWTGTTLWDLVLLSASCEFELGLAWEVNTSISYSRDPGLQCRPEDGLSWPIRQKCFIWWQPMPLLADVGPESCSGPLIIIVPSKKGTNALVFNVSLDEKLKLSGIYGFLFNFNQQSVKHLSN
jgi:hypothetical protein